MQEAINTLSQYSWWQIALILVAVVALIKWVADIISDIVTKRDKIVQQAIKKQKTAENIQARFDKAEAAIAALAQSQIQVSEKLDKIGQSIKILTESDKEDIKAFITQQHHYFCYEKGYIDTQSLECCINRFNTYEREGGNSFVHKLMDQIKALPTMPPQQ